jgi:hypothetical protein
MTENAKLPWYKIRRRFVVILFLLFTPLIAMAAADNLIPYYLAILLVLIAMALVPFAVFGLIGALIGVVVVRLSEPKPRFSMREMLITMGAVCVLLTVVVAIIRILFFPTH